MVRHIKRVRRGGGEVGVVVGEGVVEGRGAGEGRAAW